MADTSVKLSGTYDSIEAYNIMVEMQNMSDDYEEIRTEAAAAASAATAASTAATNAVNTANTAVANAQTYAGNANTSAGEAAGYASDASTSATNAASSETNASNSASAAASSESNAATSETNAAASAAAAAATLNNRPDLSVFNDWQTFTAPTIFSNRLKVVPSGKIGGYKKVGNLVYVHYTFQMNTNLNKGAWTIAQGFPQPFVNGGAWSIVPLTICAWYGDNESGYFVGAEIAGDGALYLILGGNVTAGTSGDASHGIVVHGVYMAK